VVGDAGVGKSRLCHDFVERCRRRGVPVYEAHCVSHGQAIPFLPILDLLRSYLGIGERDGAADARAKIRDVLIPLDAGFESSLPLLFDFLGVPDPAEPPPRIDPEARERQLGDLLRRMIRTRSEREPSVVLIDDVHWIDGASEVFLREIVDAVPGTRTLLLLNFRPEYHSPSVAGAHGRELTLAPLGARAARELIDELLGSHRSLARLPERIRERAAGNPFFIEEVVHSLVEARALDGARGRYRLVCPAAEVAIPVTIQAVLAARIDRLGDQAKTVLQTAAVIGRTFARSVLRRVVGLPDGELDGCLRTLAGATLIHDEPGGPEPEFTFHHPLTQEVTYRSQLASQRVRLHADVAQALEALNPEKLDECAALIAYHWESATDPRQAATWHARAATWTGVTTQSESIRHWRKVRDLLRGGSGSAEADALVLTACVRTMNLGWRLGLPPGEADLVFEDGKALAERLGDTRSLAMLANLYVANLEAGMGHTRRSRARRYRDRAREAGRLARQTEDLGVRLAVCVNRLYSLFFAGSLRAALAFLDETLDQAPLDHRVGAEMYLYSPVLWIRSFRGQLLSYMGRPAEAESALREAVQSAATHGEHENRGWAEGFYVTHSWAVGNTEAALVHARAAVEIADATGSAFSRVLGYKALGLAHTLDAAWSDAIQVLDTSLCIAREAKANVLEEASVLALLAEAHLGAGKPATARRLAEEAVAAARRRRTPVYECQAQLARAAALLEPGGASAGRAVGQALARARALIEETGARSYAPFVHEQRAALARLRGDWTRCRRELSEARRQFLAIGAAGHARRIDGQPALVDPGLRA
jgi:adenylate cyclase